VTAKADRFLKRLSTSLNTCVPRPLQLPQVAADAEFSNLPFLGWALSGLGTLAKMINDVK